MSALRHVYDYADACVCVCKCACFRACVNLCMLSVVGRQKLRPRNGGGDTRPATWPDCNRRCICTYVRPWLYGGWHATGVCRARQLIKPTSKRCLTPPLWYLSPLLALLWTIYTGSAPLRETDLCYTLNVCDDAWVYFTFEKFSRISFPLDNDSGQILESFGF